MSLAVGVGSTAIVVKPLNVDIEIVAAGGVVGIIGAMGWWKGGIGDG